MSDVSYHEHVWGRPRDGWQHCMGRHCNASRLASAELEDRLERLERLVDDHLGIARG